MSRYQVLVVLADGVVDETASELVELARRMGDGEEQPSVAVALLGHEVSGWADQLAALFDDVYLFDDPILAPPDGARLESCLLPLIKREEPLCVLIPNTNNGLDLAPGLAARSGRSLVTDCTDISISDGRLKATRPVYGGKVYARVTVRAPEAGYVATIRPGSTGNADGARPETTHRGKGEIHHESVQEEPSPGRRVVETVKPEAGAVDISQADRLVAVGRGIEDEQNLGLITSLCEALGAEIACSRPVVDKQWLEKSRQVGTSGVSVRPSLYIAIGISGSFQHLGGVKGKPYLVAINKDPRAPIFDAADVGVIGDLFDIVPLLDEKIRQQKP